MTPEQARVLLEHPGFRDFFRHMVEAINATVVQAQALMAALAPYRRAEVRRVHTQYRQRRGRRW